MRILLAVFIFFLPVIAWANAELHAIGVYEGNIKTNGRIHGGEVRVFVDRTTAPVILSIGSYEPVRWFIETTQETRVENIILHGYRPKKSEVFLNGVEVAPQIIEGVRSSYRSDGRNFRRIIEALES